MRRIITLTIAFITIAISTFSQSTSQLSEPDFAKPKTTLAEAEKALAHAQRDGNDAEILSSLIVIARAEMEIDNASLPQTIARISNDTQHIEDPTLVSLAYLLRAKLTYNYYNSSKWKFDSRDLPLTPLPVDMSQWSGKQFVEQITALVDSSLVNRKNLFDIPITRYPTIVEIDDASVPYYPTMLDFVLTTATEIATTGEGKYSAIALESHPKGSLPWMLLQTNRQKNTNQLEDLIKEHIGNPNCSLALIDLGTRYSAHDDSEIIREYITTVNDFLNRFPECPQANNLKQQCARLLQQSVEINHLDYFPIGKPFKVKISTCNCNKFTLKVFRKIGNSTRISVNANPIISKLIEIDGIAPFQCDTTETLTINEPGTYLLTVTMENASSNNNRNDDRHVFSEITGINVFPFVSSANNEIEVITCDPVSGQPLSDVSVTGRYNTNGKNVNIALGTTNKSGITEFKSPCKDKTLSIDCKYNGVSNKDIISIGTWSYSDDREDSMPYCNIITMTDRAVYHRGDSVQWVTVMYESKNDESFQVAAYKTLGIKLLDTNQKEIASTTDTTDAFGRVSGAFAIPNDCLSGNFTIISTYSPMTADGNVDSRRSVRDYKSFIVSDYKLPTFEVLVSSLKLDSPQPGFVTIVGEAKTYSGVAVADAEVKSDVRLSSWWHRKDTYGKVHFSLTTSTDAYGKFTIVIPKDSLQNEANKYPSTNFYEACILVTSTSGETQQGFKKFTFGKPYRINANIESLVDREKSFAMNVEVNDADCNTVNIPLNWAITTKGPDPTTLASGGYSGNIKLTSSIKPGKYILKIFPENEALADTTTNQINVYSFESDDLKPLTDNIFIPENEFKVNATKTTVNVKVGCAKDSLTIFYQSFKNGKITTSPFELHQGWNMLEIPVEGLCDNQTSTCELMIFGVNNMDDFRTSVNAKYIHKEPTLEIETVESFRDNLIPGKEEHWHFSLRRNGVEPVAGALVLDMYNRALDVFQNNSIGFHIHHDNQYFSRIFNSLHVYPLSRNWTLPYQTFKTSVIGCPTFRYIISNGVIEFPIMAKQSMGMMRSMNTTDLAGEKFDSAAVSESELEESSPDMAEANGNGNNPDKSTSGNYVFRESETPLALWKPMLTSGDDGTIDLRFTVPNANASWKFLGVAWSKDMLIGRISHEFTAAKPVMVTPNMPRFVRSGDSPTILTTVTNNTDSSACVKVIVEVFNPLTDNTLSKQENELTIEANSSQIVSTDLPSTMEADAFGVRVLGTLGNFTDGEQNIIPILPCEQTIIETERFYLDPSENEWSTRLPNDSSASVTLEFTENPAWTVVSALPGLLEPNQETATAHSAALFSAAVAKGLVKDMPELRNAIEQWLVNPADSALISPLEQNSQLKTAMLKSTPWVQAAESESTRMAQLGLIFNDKKTIEASIEALAKLQGKDGGWRWGEWTDESSQYITLLVLERIGYLRNLNYLPKNKKLNRMITSALNYLDNNVEKTNSIYTLVRTLYYNDKPNTANGKRVIENTIADMKKNWKEYPVGKKANMAEILWVIGNKNLARNIIQSVGEYAVTKPGRGAEFPSSPSISNTANVLRAYTRIAPNDTLVDALRQNLIVRKKSQDWGSLINTTDVVATILTCGTKWTSANTKSSIIVGDSIIQPSTIETATGQWLVNLSDFSGENVMIERSGKVPSFGCLYTIASHKMTETEASNIPDLSIEKSLIVRRGEKWIDAGETQLKVGDRVRLTLTIKNRAQSLDYVVISDERPAAFEPVEQMSTWIWSEGVGFYRENNDSATNLFVNTLPKGTFILTYDMFVNNSGTFTSGVATLQSQYAPEYSVHSSGSTLKIQGNQKK